MRMNLNFDWIKVMQNWWNTNLRMVKLSIIYFVKAFEMDKSDKKLCGHISTLYNSVGDTEKANFYSSLCAE